MNATVEIEVDTLRDVITIPLPALERSGERHYVWRVTPSGPVATLVTIGQNSLTHIEIVSGLTVGDRIHIVPPEGAKLPEPERKADSLEGELDAAPMPEVELEVEASDGMTTSVGETTSAATTAEPSADVKPVE
jgi:hypothetical protein